MTKTTVEAMVEGGKASAAPPLGPALGPTGLNMQQVIDDINKKTASFKGMQVPTKIIIDDDTKDYTIEIGTPPTSSLLKKEAGIEKGSGMAKADKVADLMIEQIIKVSQMKEDALAGRTAKTRIKTVVGTCISMGILIEGKDPKEVLKEIDKGVYDKEIESGKTELSDEERKALEEEKKKLKAEAELRKAEEEKLANEIMEKMSGKAKTVVRTRLRDAGISEALIAKLIATIAKPSVTQKPKTKK